MFHDLTHRFHDGMPVPRLRVGEFGVRIEPYLTHVATSPSYDHKSEFEITMVSFQTSVGTKLDAPRHRFHDGEDIASIELTRLIRSGVVIDARHAQPGECLGIEKIKIPSDLAGQAVLVNFGWDKFWGTERYYDHPYLSREVVQHLLDHRISMLGVDCSNVDSTSDMERPAHTWLLREGSLVVENLRGLDALLGLQFRFYAIPLPASEAAAFPIRAFAEVI
ncbi:MULTISPECIES: cyclase family protein [Rhizobium]|uniref:cyclase family protein n=1 Tax=Rhizobium TaxID=379 RepID=UPI000378FED3|nr:MULTISPECIES: cyclase family protein [Rhizobium]KAF5885249.1 cyclase family protein [Rhizobium sp. PEPV16]MBY3335020.1 cyclase family protein [Rhizobium laguerreae]MBY3488869.1 cyclase family protein [Rhizobium laguerreae]MBY5747330.1 cyclase family protein [Rhizobium leguminosarum]